MGVDFTPYTIPLWTVAVVGSGLAALTFAYRHEKGAYTLLAVFAGAVLWAGGYAMQLSADAEAAAILWFTVRYTGSTIVPTAIFVLALQVTGRRRFVSPKTVAALALVPALTNVLLWTTYLDLWSPGLWVLEYSYYPDPNAVIRLTAEFGVWFPIYTFYSLGVAFAAVALFAESALSDADESLVTTSSALLVATVLPTLGTFVYVVGYSAVDFGPFAFVVSGVLIMGAMFYL